MFCDNWMAKFHETIEIPLQIVYQILFCYIVLVLFYNLIRLKFDKEKIRT